jgi:hypothetical protein
MSNTMPRRPGKTSTFSISVDEETRKILRAEAKRSYGGNVSALVAAIAKEVKRRKAFDYLLAGVSPMTAAQRQALLDEIDGKLPPKKKRRAA